VALTWLLLEGFDVISLLGVTRISIGVMNLNDFHGMMLV
jgi:hypothetical protein